MVHVIICYKNFSTECNISHIGMGVTAAYTAKTLNHHGYYAEARPIFGADDLSVYIQSQEPTRRPVTHVVICAQWIDTKSMATMVRRFPHIHFALNCHSNAGFLQAEPPAITLIRDAINLEMTLFNFHAASNNLHLAQALQHSYGQPVTHLPNLYFLHGEEPVCRPLWAGGMLRIGCFGSLRPYKNFSTAIVAAIELTNQLKCHSEIWINSGREDGHGNVVYRAAVAWTQGLPNVTLKLLPWSQWADFRRFVGSMNLLLQPSYTETFNNVTADGITAGTPSVVGEAIDWVPNSWQANVDNANDVAAVGRRLLYDPRAAHEGYESLNRYVHQGLPYWKKFLELGQ